MMNDQTIPMQLDDADCDTIVGGATPLMMGMSRIVVSKPIVAAMLTEFGEHASGAAKLQATAVGPT